MRASTLKAEIVSVDKSTKTVNKITKSYDRMTKTINKESKIASSAYSRFAKNVGLQSKRLALGLNNVNASVNRTFRSISNSKLALGFGVGLLAILGSVTMANIDLDASIASLQAITGKTGTDFVEFRKEIDEISKSQKLFAGDTAKAFEIVGSAQPILLKNAAALGEVTKASITLKKAGLIPIEDSAKAVTGTMNQFELGSEHASRVINALAAGAKEGSANIRELSESMDRVGAVAKAANMTLEQTGAAVELMSKFNLKGSEAGISLKSTILRLKSASLGFASGQFNLNDALAEYNQQMNLIKDPIKKAAKEEEVFGKIHILTGKILTENIGELNRLTEAMTGTNEATIQANINNNTFKNRLAEISAAWKNAITASEGQGKQMQWLKDIMVKVADNMDKIVSFAIILIKAFVLFKSIVLANAVVMGVYNIALGVMGALSGTASIAIGSSTVALTAYNIASKAAAAATWLFSAALWANPITWIVIGIIALVAAIILLIKYWKEIVTWVKESDNAFAKIIRAALYPLILTFKLVKIAINSTIQAFKDIINWVKESDNGFAKFIRGSINFVIIGFKTLVAVLESVGEMFSKVWDWIKKIGGSALKPIKEIINFFSKKTQDELGINATKEIKVSTKSTEEECLIKAINNNNIKLAENNKELDKNSAIYGKDGWSGKFSTSILKDANISERASGLAQREIATSAIVSENNITNTQSDVIKSASPQSVVAQKYTPQRQGRGESVTVTIVDKTGGKFGLEVESTGIQVITTGNA